MLNVKIAVPDDKLIPLFKHLEVMPAKAIKDALNKWRMVLAGKARTQVTKGPPTVSVDEGFLYKAINQLGNYQVSSEGDTYTLSINNLPPYAAKLNIGGVINMKDKFLTVPIFKSPAKEMRGATQIPLTKFKNTVLQRVNRGDTKYVVWWVKNPSRATTAKARKKQDYAKNLVPIYTLRTKVTLRPHPWFTNAIVEAMPKLDELLRAELAEGIQKG